MIVGDPPGGAKSRAGAMIAGRLVGRRQLIIFAILVLALALDGLDLQLLALTAPKIMAQWGVKPLEFSPALAAALVGMAVGAPAGGWLGDRYGRKPALLLSGAVFALCTAATAIVSNVEMLTVARFACGLGLGAAAPNAVALATEWLPQRWHARAVSILAIGVPGGGMLGTIVVGAIEPNHGWGSCFLFAGAVTVAALLAVGVAVPESAVYLEQRGEKDAADRLLARNLATEAYEDAAHQGEDRPETPDFDTSLGFLRLNTGLWAAAFAANYVIYTAFNWFPTLFVGQGWQMAQALQAMFVFNSCTVIGSLIAGPLVARLGTRLPALLSAGLIAASFLALGAISRMIVSKDSIAPLAVALGGAGAGLGSFLAAVWMLANSGYPTHLRARGIGMMLTMSRLGGISSVFGGGWLLSRIGNDVNSVTGVLVGMLVLGGAGMVLINRHMAPLPSAPGRPRTLAQERV